MLSMLATAKSVLSLLMTEGVAWTQSKDQGYLLLNERGRGPILGPRSGEGWDIPRNLSCSSLSGFSGDWAADVARSSTPLGLYVLPDVNRHKKIVSLGIFNVSSLFHMEGGRNRGRTIWAPKKIDINLLECWNKCELELVAFLLFPYPGVHCTLCLLCSGGGGGGKAPLPQKQLHRKWQTNPPSGCGPASI